MKINRISAAAAALIMLVTAGGCQMFGGSSDSLASPSNSILPSSSPTDEPQIEKKELVLVQPGDGKFANPALMEALEKEGIDLEVNTYPAALYEAKIELLTAGGIGFDLFTATEDFPLYRFAKKNLALELKPSAELKKLFPAALWEKGIYRGKIYGVPAMYSMPNGYESLMGVPTDVLKAAGYDEFAADDMGELFAVLQRAVTKEGQEADAFTWFTGAPTWLHRTYEDYPFSVDNFMNLALVTEKGEVSSYYESDIFEKDAAFYRRLYVNNRVKSDVLKTSMPTKGAVLPSQGFNDYNTAGRSLSFTAVGDKELYATEVDETFTLVSKNSKNPEKALDLMTWLYSSRENYDLFHYGQEGTDYTLDEKGNRITKAAKSRVSVNEQLTGYRPYMRYGEDIPSSYIKSVSAKADEKKIASSASFTFDSTGLEDQCRLLEKAVIKYIYPIKYGVAAYDDAFEEAREALYSAGLEDYISAYKKQYKAFLAGEYIDVPEVKATAKPKTTEKPKATAAPSAKPESSGEN